jgi:hypothetical protein
MMNQDEMALFDKVIRETIFTEQERVGRSDRSLGAQAFGFLKTPHMKMQSIKGGGSKPPQQLRCADIINLCEALGLSWEKIMKEALKVVKSSGC